MKKTIDDDEILALYNKLQSQREVSRKLDMPHSTVNDAIQRARKNIYKESKVDAPRQIDPYKHKVKRIIFTSAQDGTKVHEPFMENLVAFADFHDAELIVAGYTYNKNPFIIHKDEESFSPLVGPYLSNDRINVGDNLTFCGEMNTLPTAVRPLSGLETYTQERDGIFPHAKVALVSVATRKADAAKINTTTGTVTVPNYIAKKAGQKARFHHVYGAVIVELTPDGNHYVRHILGDEEDGSFYDLQYYVAMGAVMHKPHDTVDVVSWGDIHVEKADKACFEQSFGPDESSVMNHLRPAFQCLHDVTDFSARNHHNVRDHHFIYESFVNGKDSVDDGMYKTYEFLKGIQRDWCTTYVIESNHHEALLTWLKGTNYKTDAVNSVFFLKCEVAIYEAMGEGNVTFDIYEHVLRKFYGDKIDKVVFIPEDGSLLIHDIEFGFHGHRGASGSRGSLLGMTKIGTKVTIGHSHAAGIHDGAMSAGVSGKLDMIYNKGASPWSQSHVLTYKSGKRTIITRRGDRFYA